MDMPDSEMGKMDFPGAIKALKDAGFTREAAVLQRLAENMASSRDAAINALPTVGRKQ